MCLTRKERYRLITGRELPKLGEQRIEYQRSGPGEFDPLRCLDEKADNWQTIQTLQDVLEKPRIIFCFPALSKTVLSDLENSLFDGLCDDFDVYIWHGPQPFSEMRPVADDKILREQMSSAAPDNKDDVLQVFEQQRLATNNLYIWDVRTYSKMLQKASMEISNYFDDDLLELNNKRQLFDKNFDLSDKSLTKIFNKNTRQFSLYSPSVEEVLKIRQYFPNLNKLKLHDVSTSLITDNLSLFNNLHLDIQGDICNSLSHLILNKQIILKGLILKDCGSLQTIELQGAQIDHILIIHCSNFQKLICNTPDNHLTTLSISRSNYLSKLHLKNFNKLKFLSILNCLDFFPNETDFASIPLLEHIKLNQCAPINAPLDFSACSKLKLIDVPENANCILPAHIANLNEAKSHVAPSKKRDSEEAYRISNYKQFQRFQGLSNYERIIVDGYQLRSKEISERLAFDANSHIKSVVIEDIEEGTYVDLSALKEIQELIVPNNTGIIEPNIRNFKRLIYLDKTYTPETHLVLLKYDSVENIQVRGNKNHVWLPTSNSHLRTLLLFDVTLPNGFDFNRYPNLTKLILLKCRGIEQATLPNGLQYLMIKESSLKEFNMPEKLKSFTYERKQCGGFNLSNLPSLSSVSIRTRTNPGSPFVISCYNCPQLQEMEIIAIQNHVMLVMDNSENIKYLRIVIFNGFKLLTPAGLEACRKLRSLDLIAGNVEYIIPRIPKEVYKHSVNLHTTSLKGTKTLQANEQERKLNIQNSHSPVTFFSSQYMDKIDAKTSHDKSYKADPNQHQFAGAVFSNTKKASNLYRINPFNGIFWIGDTIDFFITFNLKKINLVQQSLPKEISGIVNIIPLQTLFAYVEGTAKKDHPSPILCPQAIEKSEDILQVFVDPVGSADIVWDADKQQCYAMAKTTQKIRVLLQVKENPAYENENTPIKNVVTAAPEQIFALPSKESIEILKKLHEHDPKIIKLLKHQPKALLGPLRQKLAAVDKKHHAGFSELYTQLFQSSLKIEQKLQVIINYCKNQFTAGNLNAKEDQPLDVLIETIVLRKGACRHVSRAFWVLAGLIGIPVLMPSNEQHQFVDIPYRDHEGLHFQRIDLGGFVRLDITPPEVRNRLLQTLVPDRVQSEEKRLISPQALLEEAKEQEYYQSLKRLVTPCQLDDWKELLNDKFTLPPLIELNSNQDALQCCGQLFKTFQENKFDMEHFHTIHSVEEFKKFFEPLALVEGQWQRLAEGPLKKSIKHKGVLVVDWSGFSATEVASYKSILDTPPMLFEYPFPLQVINIAKSGTASCAAFKSRTQPLQLNPKLLASTVEEKKEVSLPKLKINLYGNPSWRKTIYGKIKYQGKQKILTESKLIKAIKEQKPIEIIFNQPPTDKDFEVFKYRLEVEKRLFFNGQFLPVPSNIKVTIQNIPHNNSLPSNLILNASYEKPHNRIYLNANNLHELKQQLIVDEKQQGQTMPGLFETAGEDDVFCFTENIPQAEWIPLLRFIKKLKKPIHLVTADQTEIKIPDCLFVSNDPDYLAEQLALTHQALIIDVTPETTFKSLITEIEDSLSGFIYRERDMLKILTSRNVILNGAISPTLYHQLLPLFTEPSQIRVNGKIQTVAGKLMLVQPKDASFIPGQSKSQEYHFTDYKKNLVGEEKTGNELFSRLEKFYDHISKLPHNGSGVPKKPVPGFHLLERMLRELKKERPLHPRNPIKAIFSYDYPKESEEYAYINVIAKCLFTPHDATHARIYKLQKIMQQFQIDSAEKMIPHMWRILNCFNGAELCSLLKGREITFADDLTFLSSVVFKKLPLQTMQSEKKADRAGKQLAEFKSLLAEEGSDLLMIKGDTGVGKTETVRRQLPGQFSELHNIHEWLTGSKKYLLLDEANMKKPGVFDFLKGLTRKDRMIYYPPTGKFYEIPPGKKVIMTANPEHFPGRYWHDFFRNYVKTCYFKKPSDVELKTTTLASIDNEAVKDHLLFVYHLFEKYNPFLTSSYRDIENLRDRFLCLSKLDKQHAAFEACLGQYAGAIQDTEKREAFINDLTSRFGAQHIKKSYGVRKIDNVLVTPQKEYLVNAVEQDLLMRDVFIKNYKEGDLPSYKPAVVIEGEPGTGKSSLLRAIAAKYDPITISGGSKNVDKILVDAFHAGTIVILDEFNLDPELEILRNELMSGRYQGELAKKPGFMILASQNASSLQGRKSQSPAEINRTHFLYMDAFTHRERIQLAEAVGIHAPKAFARAYKKLCSETHAANMRTFFVALDEEIAKQKSINKASMKPLETSPVQTWINFFAHRLDYLHKASPRSEESEQLSSDLKTLQALKEGKDIAEYPKSEALQDLLKSLSSANS